MNLSALVAAFISDRLSKEWAKKNLLEGELKHVVPGKLYFRRVRNYGFPNNVMSGQPELVKNISAAALAICVLFGTIELKDASKAEKAAFSVMLGGGLSNLTDRYLDGYVTDFICFKEGKTLIFNIADFIIFAGSACFTAFSIFRKQ